MEFEEELRVIKQNLGVFTNKELAKKLGLTADAIKAWSKKRNIPQKYKHYIENQFNGNVGQVIKNHHGDINIGHNQNTEIEAELIEIFRSLDKKQKDYFYHLMKAEKIKNEM